MDARDVCRSLAALFNQRSRRDQFGTAACVVGLLALGGGMTAAGVPLVVAVPFTSSAVGGYAYLQYKRLQKPGPD